MKNVNQLIIIGGGYSLKKGISKGLIEKLRNKFVICCNFAIYHFKDYTFATYVDKDYYEGKISKFSEKQNKKHIEILKSQPLIIGMKHNLNNYDNTIMLSANSKYKRDLSQGVYKSSLIGIFALSLGIYLLNEGEIYLCGMDYGGIKKEDGKILRDEKNQVISHYYNDDKSLKHRGLGKISHYNSKGRVVKDYGVFSNEKKIKIYNVSLVSNIPESIFPKISWKEFFKMLDNKTYNQDKLRKRIKGRLNG